MTSPKQVEANRANAQSSTGPSTVAGKERSSRNSLKHGFTGLNLVLTEGEEAPYAAHVAAYLADHRPSGQRQTELVHQLASIDWQLHQLDVQQTNTLSFMNGIHTELKGAAYTEIAAAIAPHSRHLNTLIGYERTKRRARKTVAEELEALVKAAEVRFKQDLELAAVTYRIKKAAGEAWDPQENGFVCSLDEVVVLLESREAVRMMISSPE